MHSTTGHYIIIIHSTTVHYIYNTLYTTVHYILLKALPRVCMENTALGGVSRDKYSTRRSRVLYLSRDTSPSAVFLVQTTKGSALGGILIVL